MKKIKKFLSLNKTIFSIIVFILCFSNIIYSQSVSVNYNMSSLTPGSTITVPIVVDGGSYHIGAFNLHLNYNTDVLTYNSFTLVDTRLTNPLTSFPAFTVNTSGANSNWKIQMYWGHLSSYFDFSNQTIVNLSFTYNGGNTSISFYPTLSYLDDENIDQILPNNFYTSGSSNGSLATISSVIGGGNWTNGASWDLGHSPNTSNGNIIINSDPSTPLILDANTTFTGNLTINSAKALTINSGKSLTLSGNFLIKSDVSGTGSFINYGSYTAANTTVERFLPAWPSSASTQGWHQISSPVANHSLVNFTPIPANSYDFFKWSEPQLLWLDQKLPVNGITAFQSGVGYLVSYQNSGNHDFTGTLINSDVSPALTYTPGSDPCKGCNLIGNPFTSAIIGTITNPGWNKVNVNDYIEVWDDASGNYLTWNGTTGSLTNGIVPAMQGFWVKTNGSNPSITIPLTARTHNAQNLYKSSALNNHLCLKVLSQNGFSDNAFVYFSNSNVNTLDESVDVPKLFGSVQESPQLYSYIGSDKFSINAMGVLSNVTIPLGFEPRINGTFIIKAFELGSFEAGTTIYLQDLKTGTTKNITQNDMYKFTSSTTDNVNRFNLIFSTTAGINDNNTSLANNIYSYGKDIFVDCGEAKVKQISIYNTIGQLIYSVNNTTGMFKYTLNGDNTTGYYIVKVITDKNVNSEKVFVK